MHRLKCHKAFIMEPLCQHLSSYGLSSTSIFINYRIVIIQSITVDTGLLCKNSFKNTKGVIRGCNSKNKQCKCCYSDNRNHLTVMKAGGLARKILSNPPFLWKCLYQVRVIAVFSVFRLLSDFVCKFTYQFCLSLWKISRCSVILLLPLFMVKR